MTTILVFIGGLGLFIQALIGLSYFLSSLGEKEPRASFCAGVQFLAMLGLFVFFIYLHVIGFFATKLGLSLLVAALVLGGISLYFIVRRTSSNQKALQGTKGFIVGDVGRFDEREIVFARNRSIRPGSDQYKIFYEEHPEYEEYDAGRRERGGPLGRPGTIDGSNGGANVAGTLASLSIPMALSGKETYNPHRSPLFQGEKVALPPGEATRRIKGYAKHIGADLVGVTEVNPLWFYSKRGEIFHENWEDWGKEIPVDHKYAVVFATEMAFEMVGAAPHTPTVIESMGNYAKGAYVASQIAAYIANLGYSATANHLRHYDAMLVPMAVDAGLGELARLGYLLTKEFGPRIRLGAVTTELPFVPDKPIDIGAEDFCDICKKCAVCCPSQSIPQEDQVEVNGTRRWKLNAETCFEYWGKVGTDCNVCMRVCPWSHARTFPHRLIVSMVSRNRIARRIFNLMDDIFYGEKPKPKSGPQWASFAAGKKS